MRPKGHYRTVPSRKDGSSLCLRATVGPKIKVPDFLHKFLEPHKETSSPEQLRRLEKRTEVSLVKIKSQSKLSVLLQLHRVFTIV